MLMILIISELIIKLTNYYGHVLDGSRDQIPICLDKLAFYSKLTFECSFLGLNASFWVTNIPSGFVTRLLERNPRIFF